MQNRKSFLIKYLALMLILVSALLLSACRTRITNNNEVSNVYYDEDGYISETYETRRSELSLSTAKKPILPDFGPIEDEEEDFETGESINYEPEEEEYVEPPEVQNANRTTNRTTRRTTTPGTSGGGNSSNRSTERVTIKFDANGGKCSTTEKKVYKGSKIGRLPVATKDGKEQSGWYTSKTGGSAVKSTDVVNTNITLYARWDEEKKKEEEEKFTVTFDAQGGTCSEKTRKVVKGKTIGTLPEASKEKKEFVGWSTSKSGKTISSSYKVTKNISLYAQWKDPDKKEFKITFDANGGTVDEKTRTVIEGDSYGNLPTPKYKGHHFMGWFIGDTQVESGDKPSQGETLTAAWNDWDGDDGIFADVLDALDSDQNYILADNAPEGSEAFVNSCRGIVNADDYDYVIQFASDPDTTGKELVDSGNYKGKTVIVIHTDALKGDKYDKILYQTVLINDLHGGFDNMVGEASQEIGKYDRYIKKVPK